MAKIPKEELTAEQIDALCRLHEAFEDGAHNSEGMFDFEVIYGGYVAICMVCDHLDLVEVEIEVGPEEC